MNRTLLFAALVVLALFATLPKATASPVCVPVGLEDGGATCVGSASAPACAYFLHPTAPPTYTYIVCLGGGWVCSTFLEEAGRCFRFDQSTSCVDNIHGHLVCLPVN